MMDGDDLVKRLREYCDGNNDLMDAAADYIENMESMIEWMENMDPKLVDEARMVLWREKNG
jgi:hypothetical protein